MRAAPANFMLSTAPVYVSGDDKKVPKSTSTAVKSYLPGIAVAVPKVHPEVSEYLRYSKSISAGYPPVVAAETALSPV